MCFLWEEVKGWVPAVLWPWLEEWICPFSHLMGELRLLKTQIKPHSLAFTLQPSPPGAVLGEQGVMVAVLLRASPESCPGLSPVGKGPLLGGPSASPEIPETGYMQGNVFVTGRLPGPFTCWFCKTLQLVDLFLSLQPENLSILKILKIHIPPSFTLLL